MTVSVSAKANLNQDLFLFPKESATLR